VIRCSQKEGKEGGREGGGEGTSREQRVWMARMDEWSSCMEEVVV